jgi:hypothetical protein
MDIIEAIIELLLANIAFVIVIAGGLYSFFKRMNDTKNTKKPSSSKQLNEHPKQNASPFGVPREPANQPKREMTISVEKRTDRKETMNKRYEDLKQKSPSNRYQDKEEAILSNFKVDHEELQKAVIWSEILSKPKALQKRM